MTNFYAVQGKALQNLGDEESIRLFRSLIFAEAWRIRLPRSRISIPEKASTTDGGLDAKIDNSSNLQSEFIYTGMVGFQVKAYDLQPAECKKEIHEGEDLGRPLKPEVLGLLNSGGTYVLVLFHELTEKLVTTRRTSLVEEFSRLGFPNVRVEVWEASKIASYCDLFASVISDVDADLLKSLPYQTWSNQGQMKDPEKYYADDARKKKAEEILSAIGSRTSALFFRIDGLPGIGKTRFVCELLREPSLSSATVYLHANDFIGSPLWFNLQKKQSTSGIFVIDECSLRQHSEIVSAFGASGDRLVFITMSYQVGQVSPPTNKFSLEALPDDLMRQILDENFSSLPFEVRHRLAEFSEGFPRIALLLGRSYLINPTKQNGRIVLEETELLNRLICGRSELGDADKRTRLALAAVALFDKIGFCEPVEWEAKWLAQAFGLSWDEFRDIIHEQRGRGIIQGDHYIYVTPIVLKVHLIEYWWESRGLSFADFSTFVNSIPQEHRSDLFSRFIEHFKYLDSSHRGKDLVNRLLDVSTGLFSNESSLREKMTANFFLILTEVNPESALRVLEKHFATWSKKDLLEFRETRRQILRSLEKIAVWEATFTRAAGLILRLAEAENETWSNNSVGTLTNLFGIGAGPVAGTEASPDVRFSFLERITESQDSEVRKIALQCLSEYLDTYGGHRVIGPEYQGTRTVAQLWRPKTYDDLFSAWRKGWELLRKIIPTHGVAAAEIAINRARGMIRIKALSEEVLKTLEVISATDGVLYKKLFSAIQIILRYEGKNLSDETRNRLVAMQTAPFGDDEILADLRRYVGVHAYSDPDGLKEDVQRQRELKIMMLAEHFLRNLDDLKRHFDWLFGPDAESAWEFGRALGKVDKQRDVLALMHQYMVNHLELVNSTLIGGYIRAVREEKAEEADQYLERLANSPAFRLTIDVVFRSGASDRAIDLLIDTDSKHVISAQWYGPLAYGGTLKEVSASQVNRLIECIISKGDSEAAGICAQILEFYYKGGDPDFPADLAAKVLLDSRFTHPPKGYRVDTMTEHYWNEIAKKVFDRVPQYRLQVALRLIENFGEDGSITDGISPMAAYIINQAASENPHQIWDKVAPCLLDTNSSTSFWLRGWLKKSIRCFPKELVLNWISVDPGSRALAVADVVPKNFSHDSGSLARDLIERYGSDENVRSALGSMILDGVWSGPFSAYYEETARFYADLAKNEPQPEIRAWFIEMGGLAERAAKEERIREEKRGY